MNERYITNSDICQTLIMPHRDTFGEGTILAMKSFNLAFAKRLKEEMLEQGHVAKRGSSLEVDVGVLKTVLGLKSLSIARRYLQGEALPRPEKMVKLAKWLNVNIAWLRDGVGPKRGGDITAKQPDAEYSTKISPEALDLAERWQMLPKPAREFFYTLISRELIISNEMPWLKMTNPADPAHQKLITNMENSYVKLKQQHDLKRKVKT